MSNPVKLQMALNEVRIPESWASSFEDIVKKRYDALAQYKESVKDFKIYESDWKKLFALPFYMTKRT